ncbi:MAG: carbohydrate ABC transporter permease [Lachnospiraceae bacterium]
MQKKIKPFQVCIYIFISAFALIAIIPFALLIISSLTEENTLVRNGYSFLPEQWSLESYKYLLEQGGQILHAYGISIFVTVIGVVAGLSMTLMLAYPLSRHDLPGRKQVSFYVFFTMLFSGGLVPSYIMWTTVFGIKNTIWALIVPNLLMKAFFVILARSYFQTNLPLSIIESARIDGAGEVRIFLNMALPLSKPIISTLVLFIGLDYWNDWNNGLIYLTDSNLYSIQNVLNEMIKSLQFLQQNAGVAVTTALPSNGVRMAIAVVGVLPVLIAYPFLQKGFVKGIVMGGVKG